MNSIDGPDSTAGMSAISTARRHGQANLKFFDRYAGRRGSVIRIEDGTSQRKSRSLHCCLTVVMFILLILLFGLLGNLKACHYFSPYNQPQEETGPSNP